MAKREKTEDAFDRAAQMYEFISREDIVQTLWEAAKEAGFDPDAVLRAARDGEHDKMLAHARAIREQNEQNAAPITAPPTAPAPDLAHALRSGRGMNGHGS